MGYDMKWAWVAIILFLVKLKIRITFVWKMKCNVPQWLKFLPRPYVRIIAKPYTYAACLLHWALSNSWILCEMLFILLWSRFTCTHHICKFLHWELATTCHSFHPNKCSMLVYEFILRSIKETWAMQKKKKNEYVKRIMLNRKNAKSNAWA